MILFRERREGRRRRSPEIERTIDEEKRRGREKEPD
jgi:hypothetical protein